MQGDRYVNWLNLIIPQCIHVLNHHIIGYKYIQIVIFHLEINK
jgi:hypothetical protein